MKWRGSPARLSFASAVKGENNITQEKVVLEYKEANISVSDSIDYEKDSI